MISNPFIVGTYVSEKYFCDRDEESKTLIDHLRNKRNVVLFSERRMGKTGLIQHVFHKTELIEQYDCLYFDALSCNTLQDFTFSLTNCIFRGLPKKQGLTETIARFFKSLQLNFQIDPYTGAPEVSLSLGAIAEPGKTLEEAFRFLNEGEKPVILAIDEFQKILSFKQKETAALMRGLIQNSPNVTMIYAGSEQHLLSELFMTGRSPFYQSTSSLYLEAINIQAYQQFAQRKFEEFGKVLSGEVFQEAYERVNGCTWFVQSLLNRIFAATSAGEKVSSEAVKQALNLITSEQEVFYRALLETLPLNQKALLFAVTKDGEVENPTSSAFVRKHQLPSASSVQSAARSLIERGILVKKAGCLRVYDYFFDEWLRSNYL